MSTPREQITAQFKTDHPAGTPAAWDVYDWPVKLTELRRPAAVVYRTTLAPAPGGLSHEITLELYGTKTEGPDAEAELDDLLDAAMLSLQRLGPVAVKKAERTTFGGVFQGWAFELSWTSSDIYKAQV